MYVARRRFGLRLALPVGWCYGDDDGDTYDTILCIKGIAFRDCVVLARRGCSKRGGGDFCVQVPSCVILGLGVIFVLRHGINRHE